MKQLKYERIDKGQKRTKRAPQPRTRQGVYLPVCSPEKRQEIIEYALTALTRGETTDQIAAQYEIDGSTLRRWLLSLDDVPNECRKIYWDGELSQAREEIKTAAEPFTLARAREDFRAASWLAERRMPQYYGQKQEVTHNLPNGPLINIQLSAAPQLPQDSTNHNVIEHASTPEE